MAFIEDDETLQAFKEESREHLDGIESDLLAIEEGGANIDPELVNKVFRAMHSIKGGAGFLGLDAVKSLAHAAEDLLNKVRNAELVPTAPVVSSLLDAADGLNRLLNLPKGAEEIDISSQLAALHAMLSPTAVTAPPTAAPPPPSSAAIIEDDETMQAFKEESREHLDGIESDLLAIEEGGANLDHELVNKVFRAMHSIKGGAGFLGLDAVKSLAHAAEDLLNKVRNAELVPTAPVVSSLLNAADVLNRLLNLPKGAGEIDISSPLAALHEMLSPPAAPAPPSAPTPTAAVPPTSVGSAAVDALLTSHTAEMVDARLAGHKIFILEYDLINDLEPKGISPMTVLHDLGGIGQTIAVQVDDEAVGDLGTEPDAWRLPVHVLFSTLMDKDMLISFANLPAERTHEIPAESTAMDATPAEPVPAPTPPASQAPSRPPPPPPPPPPPASPAPPAPQATPKPSPAGNEQATVSADSSIRVNVRILDNLMTLAGELVLTRNQFLQIVHSPDPQDFDTVSQRLDLVTSELQEAIMTTRMQPVGNVFNKFKRVVRDLAQKLGKEIELILEGGEVEMDKTIIEALTDPLTHLVRNSVDHGIEMPAKRKEAGKPPTGTLRLTAFHEGGQVIIEIADDGAGIDTARLKEKVMGMGTHDKAQLEAMQEHELLRLIFLPGLSTAKEVTEVSGRGVGMDVVHANLSKVGGVFDIASKLSRGTTITIKLPLTLAIIPSLIVTVAGERYAIPQVNMVELVRVPAAKVKDRIEKIGSALVMRLRGELLPLIRLDEILGITERSYHDQQEQQAKTCRRRHIEDRRGLQPVDGEVAEIEMVADDQLTASQTVREKREWVDRRCSPHSAVNILVVSVGKFHYGLIVDKLLDSEEIVVKPLGSHLRKCQIYAGATIQGDGKVALILDVVGISKVMNLSSVSDRVRGKGQQEAASIRNDAQTLLIVRNSPNEQMAIPLSLVSRIEKISARQIEITGGRRNMQYRNASLPLFTVDQAATVAPLNGQATHYYVVVFPFGEREVGVMVSEIIDIIKVAVDVDDATHKQPGIMGSAIILQQITMLVDLFGIVATVMPDWLKHTSIAAPENGKGQNILVVEDSKFFNKQICDFVSAAGYTTFSAMDGVEALAVLEKQSIDLVLTDIEMPNMDGLELTTRIRADLRWAKLPIIALTSVAGEAAEKRGLKAGINEYMIKLDREKTIHNINRYLRR